MDFPRPFQEVPENRRAVILARIAKICDLQENSTPIAIGIGIFRHRGIPSFRSPMRLICEKMADCYGGLPTILRNRRKQGSVISGKSPNLRFWANSAPIDIGVGIFRFRGRPCSRCHMRLICKNGGLPCASTDHFRHSREQGSIILAKIVKICDFRQV